MNNETGVKIFCCSEIKYDDDVFVNELMELVEKHTKYKTNDLTDGKIIHFKIPTDEYGQIMVDFETIESFSQLLESALPDDMTVVMSPFDPSVIEFKKE